MMGVSVHFQSGILRYDYKEKKKQWGMQKFFCHMAAAKSKA